MRISTPALILIFILFFSSCDNTRLTGSSAEVNKILEQLVIDNDLPGLNLSVIGPDGEQETWSAGYADVEENLRMNADYVMFSGSIGKTYAVAVLMQLVDEGKVNLSDRIIDHFPDQEWLYMLPNIQDISIKMLLQHTSGLPRYVLKPGLWDSLQVNPDKIWSYPDRMSFIYNDEAVHPAGKGWSYSDSGYILLGMLIEKITGMEYYDCLESRILSPEKLGYTYPSNRRDIKNLPQGYSSLPELFRMPGKVVENGNYCFNPQMEWTGGGIASTTSDLARWAKIYYSGTLFSDSLFIQVYTPSEYGKNIEDSLSYGMGSFIFETEYGKAYGHTGFVPGFVSIFACYLEHDIAVAMQVNCDYAAENLKLIDYLDHVIPQIIPKTLP